MTDKGRAFRIKWRTDEKGKRELEACLEKQKMSVEHYRNLQSDKRLNFWNAVFTTIAGTFAMIAISATILLSSSLAERKEILPFCIIFMAAGVSFFLVLLRFKFYADFHKIGLAYTRESRKMNILLLKKARREPCEIEIAPAENRFEIIRIDRETWAPAEK
jgi:hypothetical protein